MKNLFVIPLLFFLPLHSQDYKSQYDQDRFVNEHFFHDKQDGFFLDIGAHDGVSFSNTYYFNQCLGWKGICFEPREEIFKTLEVCRDCICINACVANVDGLLPFLSIESCDEMLSGLCGTYDQRALDAVMADIGYYGGEIKMLQMPCVRLMPILERYGVSHIDFFSLDTEGNELEILKTIDFSKIVIDVITVENNYNEPFIQEFLIPKGFTLVMHLGVDDIYVRDGCIF